MKSTGFPKSSKLRAVHLMISRVAHRRAAYEHQYSAAVVLTVCALLSTAGCGTNAQSAQRRSPGSPSASSADSTTVSVIPVEKRRLGTSLTLSSELIPFEEIDVYAKVAGYIKQLLVDYGTHVHQGQLMAILEIPELQAQLEQDQAAIKAASDQVIRAEHDIRGYQAQAKVAHLIYTRLSGVADSKPGLVAQQEVDDAQAKDASSAAQLQSAESALANAQSEMAVVQAKLKHDQALYQYSRIVAPFDGVVTQRYANLGALMQAGTNSSTQAMPLVRLSQENLFRLSIPVPESYVRYIRIGDTVQVRIPALAATFPGHVTRFSVQVAQDTRTMYTEVDVENRTGQLMPGLYAEATLSLQEKGTLCVPIQALDRQGARTMVDIVNRANRVETRDITPGIQTPDYIEVLAGVREGERVIVSDRTALTPGETVKATPAQQLSYGDNKSDRQ